MSKDHYGQITVPSIYGLAPTVVFSWVVNAVRMDIEVPDFFSITSTFSTRL